MGTQDAASWPAPAGSSGSDHAHFAYAPLPDDAVRALLDGIPTHVACLDTELRFTWVNAAYARGCHRSRAELIGRGHFELFPHEENEAIFRRVLQTGDPYDVRAKPFEHPDDPERGTTYWTWSLRPLRRPSSARVEGLLLALHDVTNEVRAEQRCGTLERDMIALLEAIPDPACISRRGQVLRSNARLRALTGEPPTTLRDFLSPEDASNLDLDAASGSGSCELSGADGAVHLAHVSSHPVELGGRGALLTLFVLRDAAQTAERLRRREKEVTERARLAAVIAHDVNNLLTLIAHESYLGRLQPDGALAALNSIVDLTHRASRATWQMLALESSALPSLGPSIDIGALMKAQTAYLQNMAGDEVELELTVTPPSPVVKIHPIAFIQLLSNLVSNSLRAIEGRRRGRVQVNLHQRRESPHAQLTVEDDGVGMDGETRARLFEPFFSTRTGTRGIGLGLCVVQAAVDSCGGSIDVDSRPGHGTRVTVLLPLSPAPSATSSTDERDELHGHRPLRIVLIEPEQALRTLMRRVLEQRGHEVREALEVDGVLSLLELLRPDVLICGSLDPEDRERLCAAAQDTGLPPALVWVGQPLEMREGPPSRRFVLPQPFSPQQLLAQVHHAWLSATWGSQDPGAPLRRSEPGP